LIWNVPWFLASGNGLSQSLTFLPEDRRLGEQDWFISIRFCRSVEVWRRVLQRLCWHTDKRWKLFSKSFLYLLIRPRYWNYT
jgi:hypothetical protein